MPKDPDFRPDAGRGVFLSGEIDQISVSKLFPDILRTEGAGPVTLYIDSPGGSPGYAAMLRRMLVAPDQDSSALRRLITVVTGLAASAAADLLVAGDYTLAYEHSIIMMHGVRQTSKSEITRESAADLARSLASSNEQFAITLANNCVATFFFRVVAAFLSFDKVRLETGNQQWSDIDCYIETLRPRVATEIYKLLVRASKQCAEMADLYLEVSASVSNSFLDRKDEPRQAEFEAAIFKAILDHELNVHPDREWTFGEVGFEVLQQKMALLADQVADRHKQQVDTLRERWGLGLLTPEEANQVFSSPVEQRKDKIAKFAEPRIRQFWFLLVAICRALQTDDYFLSAEEAYWLGFIDEVIGRPELTSPRNFAEEYIAENESNEEPSNG